MVSKVAQEILDSLPAWIVSSVQGCSEEELQQLMKAQGVNCLPAVYHEIMLRIGKRGISALLHDDDSTLDKLQDGVKEYLCFELEYAQLDYPSDLFVFGEWEAYSFKFFRTRNCDDDPAVYMWWGEKHYYRERKLSTLLLGHSWVHKQPSQAEMRREAYLFDKQADEFFPIFPDS